MRLSIRYKILIVLGILLIFAVGCYTFLATSIFRQEKTALLYDINHSTAVNTASQLRSNLVQIAEQLRVYVLSEAVLKSSPIRLPPDYLKLANVKSVQIYEKGKESWQSILSEHQSHVQEAEREGYSFWSIPAVEESKFFLAAKLEVNQSGTPSTFVVVADLDPKTLTATLQSANLFGGFLVKKSGEVIFHVDHGQFRELEPMEKHPLLTLIAQKGGVASGVQSFEYKNEQWYGAYASVGVGDLYFISQANRQEVNLAVKILIERSLLFGCIVITVTFLVSILFSKGLTRNLQKLTELAQQIGQGNLSKKIELSSKDEVQELALSFNRMIDDLKASREAIEKYNRELEDKVALRTEELRTTNAQIKEVQEKLLKASQYAVAGEVAGRTAHEVLNPLTAILSRIENSMRFLKNQTEPALQTQASSILSAWQSELEKGGIENFLKALSTPSSVRPDATLLEEDVDNLKTLLKYWNDQQGTLEKDLAFVQAEAFRIQRIVDQMRVLVRTSSEKSLTDCHDAVREAINVMKDYTKKQGVGLVEKLGEGQPFAYLNRDEFIQILTNLIRNATQAVLSKDDESLADGEVRIESTCTEASIYIDVIDNGPGISSERAEKIFEAGFTTKSPDEGTGLGLSICRRYARAFGGEVILFYSEPKGRGTCFRLTLPLHAAESIKEAV